MKGLILIYAITAIAALLALRRPKIGLLVYIGYAVLRPRAIWGWAGDLDNISFIVAVAMLIGWALNGFGNWRIGRGRPVVMALLAFTAWSALSAAQALDTTRGFGAVVELLKIVLPFLVGVTMLETDKEWRAVLWTIVLAQGYVSLEMNLNYLRGNNSAAIGFGGMDNNCFGVSLVTVIGLAVTLALSSKKWYQRGLAAAAAGLILHTTLLTFSRGAMVGLGAVGLAAFFLMPKRPTYIGAILVVALVAVRFTGPQLGERYASAFASSDERDSSSESRLDLWMDCLKVIEGSPVFGVGPWNWRVIASSYGWSEGKSAHSVWMETAAETGVPGVMALFLFFAYASTRLWSVTRGVQTAMNRQEKLLVSGIILSIVGFAVAGQFVSVTGLEAPYYVAMVSAVILKMRTPAAVVATVPKPVPAVPVFTGGRSRVARVGS